MMRRYADLKIKRYTQKEARQMITGLPQRVAKVGVLSRGGKRIPLRKGCLHNVTTGLHGDMMDWEDGSPSYGCPRGNYNGDFFFWKSELLKKKVAGRCAGRYTFQTWIEVPIYENHDPQEERGIVIDTYPVFSEKGVDMVMATDALKFPELCRRIKAGLQTDVSMGCDLTYSICSNCSAVSYTDDQWCFCLANFKGRRHPRTGRFVSEILCDVTGVELSHITSGCGADQTAKNKDVLFMPDLSRRGRKAAADMIRAYYRKILGIKQ